MYANDLRKITKAPSREDEKQWQHSIDEFRAVEYEAWHRLLEIVNSEKVWNWVNNEIADYKEQLLPLVDGLLDDHVRSFLKEFVTGGQRRARAAALYAALADNLKNIALLEYDIDKIIGDSEQYLPEYVNLNLQSILNISKQWAKEDSIKKTMIFNSLPDYLKEIVSAIEQRKRRYPNEHNFGLQFIRYDSNNPVYKHNFKEIVRQLDRRGEDSKLLESKLAKIKQAFGFDILKNSETKEWSVTIFKTEHIHEIKMLGKLIDSFDSFDNIDNSTSFPESQSSKKSDNRVEERVAESAVEKSNLSNMSNLFRPDLEGTKIENDGKVYLRCKEHPQSLLTFPEIIRVQDYSESPSYRWIER